MTKECSATHPTLNISCSRPGEGVKANHDVHTGLWDEEWIDWPNLAYIPPASVIGTEHRQTLRMIKSRVSRNT